MAQYLPVRLQAAPGFRGSFSKRVGGLAAAAFIAAILLPPHRASGAELEVFARDAPQHFSLPAIDGPHTALDTSRGQIVLVHFFATWCEPCVEELPALRRLNERASGTLRVLAISVAEVDDRVRRFLAATPVNFPVLLDRDRAVAKGWKIDALPTTVVMDRNLKARLIVEADFDWDRIDPARLAAVLDADKPALDTLYRTQ